MSDTGVKVEVNQDGQCKMDPEEWEQYMEVMHEQESGTESLEEGKSSNTVTKKDSSKLSPEERRAKKREYDRKRGAKMLELKRERNMWRNRIRWGHPSLTEEKIKELKETHGLDFSKIRKLTPEEKQKASARKAERDRERNAKVTVKLEEQRERKMWRERIRRGHPSLTEEKLKELKEKFGLDITKVGSAPEEKNKWRQRMRRGHPSLTEEKLKELKEKYGLDMSEIRKMTPEEVEEERKKKTERERLRIQNVKKDEDERRKRFRNLEKRLLMTEEEKQQLRMKRFLYMQAYRASKGRFCEQPQEYRQRKLDMHKTWRRNLTPEGRKRYYESLNRNKRKFYTKLLGDDKNPESLTVDGEPSLSQLQKAYWERVKREQPEKWREWQQKKSEYYKMRYETESEEERKKRRHKEKVNGIKRKLKKQLEHEGVAKEEIDERLKLVHEQMWKEFDRGDGRAEGRKDGRTEGRKDGRAEGRKGGIRT